MADKVDFESSYLNKDNNHVFTTDAVELASQRSPPTVARCVGTDLWKALDQAILRPFPTFHHFEVQVLNA